MAVVSGTGAAVYSTSGASGVTFTNEATTANAGRTAYQITSTTKRLWDETATFTVQHDIGGGFVTVTNYRLDLAGGVINFDTAEPVGSVVRVSGKYLTATEVAIAKSWKLDIAVDTADATTFADAGWKTFVAIPKGGSGTFTGFWADNTWPTAMGSRFIARLDVVDGGPSYESYIVLSSDAIGAGVDGLVEEEVGFTTSGTVYYQA